MKSLEDNIAETLPLPVVCYHSRRDLESDISSRLLDTSEIALFVFISTSEGMNPSAYTRGITMMDQLRNHFLLTEIPVLLLGHKGDERLKIKSRGCGAVYLDLPVKKKDLFDCVKGIFEIN